MVRLFSTKISWGSGSGQQIVTVVPTEGFDEECLWIVKQAHEADKAPVVPVLKPLDASQDNSSPSPVRTGSLVKCGDILRFEHVESQKNLHSHMHDSALTSRNAEVTGYGTNGHGNPGDNFEVRCIGKKNGSVWETQDTFKLYHLELKNFMVSSSRARFTHGNCPRCPIIGHQEVSIHRGTRTPSETDAKWTAERSMMLESLGDDEDSVKAKADGGSPDDGEVHDEF